MNLRVALGETASVLNGVDGIHILSRRTALIPGKCNVSPLGSRAPGLGWIEGDLEHDIQFYFEREIIADHGRYLKLHWRRRRQKQRVEFPDSGSPSHP
jgi:hypothetical protein